MSSFAWNGDCKVRLCIFEYPDCLEIDLDTGAISTIKVDINDGNGGEAVICEKDNYLYIISNAAKDNTLYVVSMKTGEVVRKQIKMPSCYKTLSRFGNGFVIDAGEKNGVIFLDADLDEITRKKCINGSIIRKQSNIFPYRLWIDRDGINVCYSHYENRYYLYHNEDNNPYESIRITNNHSWPNRGYGTQKCIREDYMHNLKDFIEMIK